jgi:hypothetical protein
MENSRGSRSASRNNPPQILWFWSQQKGFEKLKFRVYLFLYFKKFSKKIKIFIFFILNKYNTKQATSRQIGFLTSFEFKNISKKKQDEDVRM